MKRLFWFLSTLSLILWVVGCESRAIVPDFATTQSSEVIVSPTPPIAPVSSLTLELEQTDIPSVSPTSPPVENGDLFEDEPRQPNCEPPWLGDISWGTSYALADNGRQLAYRTNQLDLIVTEVDTVGEQPTILTQPTFSIPHTRPFFHLDWSPDNGTLAYLIYDPSGDFKLRLFNLENPDSPVAHPYEAVDNFIWSPDGQMIAYSSKAVDQLNVYLFDLRNNQSVRLIMTGSHRPISWSPDGLFLALESSNDGYETSFIEIIDIVTQQSTTLTTGELCEARPVWSPDGQKIAYLTQTTPEIDKFNWDLFILDRTTGQSYQLTSTLGAMEYDLVWSLDGQQLAVTSWQQNADVAIFAIDIETKEVIELLEETEDEAPLSPQWFPDNQHLLVQTYSPNDGALQFLDVLNVNTLERTHLVQFP